MTQLDRIEYDILYLTGWLEGLALFIGLGLVVAVGWYVIARMEKEVS